MALRTSTQRLRIPCARSPSSSAHDGSPSAATAYGPCFIDIFAPLANASLGVASAYGAGDGIHLNDAGHARIFEVAEAIVKPYVCSRVACR